jgi:DNA ligase-1
LNYLLENPNGSDEVKTTVNTFISIQPEEHQEWIKRIILKDLKIGATASTFNKVWKGLISTFNVMLAHPLDRLPKRVAVEIKFDGVRATAVKIKGKSSMFTRNGKAIEGFDKVLAQLDQLPVDNCVFDGELIANNDFKETMQKVFKKGQNKEADYMIFDYLSLDEFNAGKSHKSYIERRQQIVALLTDPNYAGLPNLKIAPVMGFLENPTIEKLATMTKQAVYEGYEGIIVKDMDAPYVCKRDYGWQKCKLFDDGDFEIIRVEEGEDKNKGKMGSLILDVNGVEVGLGTGWTDKEREDAWKNPNKYIGRLVEVQYQGFTEDGSLRFPSVKCIRWDR